MLNQEIYEARHRLGGVSFLMNDNQRLFYNKVCSYQQQLEQCKTELAAPLIPVSQEVSHLEAIWQTYQASRIAELERKQEVLRQLVRIGVEVLAKGKNSVLEYEFRRLEIELNPVLFLCDDIEAYLHPAFGTIAELKEAVATKIYEHLKELRARVKVLIKKIRPGFIADLRQRFRSIMHFLFKNLDDCSDKHNAWIHFQALCLIKNNYSNAKYKNAYPNSRGVL
jgi:hypothetical protein